jgi:SAM-dependent methyltransferase
MDKIIRKVNTVLRNPRLLIDKMSQRSYKAKCDAKFRFLKQGFDDFCVIEDEKSIQLAKKLVSQQGEIDYEVEGLKETGSQRDLSVKFHWGHNHNFGNGFYVKGRMGNRHIDLIAQFMVGFGLDDHFFKNKDCIDVGCWTGGTTLMLKYLGANEIFALEEVKKYGKTMVALSNDVYGLKGIGSKPINLYDLVTDKKYDIAYFPGVIYHLSDPVLGLRRLYNSLRDGGVCLVETAGIRSDKSIASYEGSRIFHRTLGESKEELNRGGWNWFFLQLRV